MPKHTFACLALIAAVLCCSAATAQTGEGQFGCPAGARFFPNADLQFAPMDQDAIEQWRVRPALAFSGFEEQKYGFHQIAFYRWRAPLQSESQSDDDAAEAASGSIYRVQLAVRLMGAHADAWFELHPASPQESAPDDLLYLQTAADAGTDQDPDATQEQAADELAQSFLISPATPDTGLPLFLLEFSFNNEPAGTVSNRLLLDVRNGRPHISKAVQCMESEPAGGVCDAPERTTSDKLHCEWESSSGDFRCAIISPFGAGAARLATKDFYLFTEKPAPADASASLGEFNLATLARQVSRGQTELAPGVMVPELGPVTLLARYKDLLPGTEEFVFASPGAGAKFNAHFTIVTVSSDGRTNLQSIPKWVLSGEKTDERERPRGYTPLPVEDRYRTLPLEDRPGFHAFEAVLTAAPSTASDQPVSAPTHVVYWIGVEAVDRGLVTSAVRVASDGSSTASCATLHDGTAILIEPQQGMAAATVHVRPSDMPGAAATESGDEGEAPSGCVWIGGLYWKPAGGFQVRKIDEDCEAGIPDVAITEDGQITVKPAQGPAQDR